MDEEELWSYAYRLMKIITAYEAFCTEKNLIDEAEAFVNKFLNGDTEEGIEA